MRPSILFALSLLGAPAAWASVEDDLAAVGVSAGELLQTADDLDHQIAPGRAHLSHSEAVKAFEDNLFLLMIGKFRPAAEGFFALVTTGALSDPGLHRDAEWHLAEALYGMGNIATAEARFKLIAGEPKHPFREDAVRRLLEVYAESGQAKKFYEVYEREIVEGRVTPTSLITYTVARSFYKQDEFGKAKEYFQRLESGKSHYSRGRYFLGVIAILEDRMADAERFFQEAADASIESDDQRDAHDMALLALARIAYERGDFVTATDFYQQIAGDSKYLADVLYETVWTFIKQEHYDEALQAVELFLLAYPEHQYTGELKVVQGHLHMGCGQFPEKCRNLGVGAVEEGDSYDQALASYESIVLEYTPIREKFATLARSDDEPKLYFEQALAIETADATEGVPEFAIAMMRDDVELSAALDVYKALQRQRKDVEECEQMVNELEIILASDASLGGIESARYRARANRTRAVQEQVTLLGIEAEWLKREGANTTRFASDLVELMDLSADAGERIQQAGVAKEKFEKELATLRGEIAQTESDVGAAEKQLTTLRASLDGSGLSEDERARYSAEASEIETQLGKDRIRLGELRTQLTSMQAPDEAPSTVGADKLMDAIANLKKGYEGLRPNPNSETAKSIDELHRKLRDAARKYESIQGRLGALAESELGRIKERFQEEAVLVSKERQDLEGISGDADRVSVALTREGFQRMETFFAESVLKADMGIVDVYWARKLELADEKERIQQERNLLFAELTRRFEYIRQKMEQ